MNLKRLAILTLMALVSSACSEQSQNLFILEMERECVSCNLAGVDLSGQNLSARYRYTNRSKPLSVGPRNLIEAGAVNLTEAELSSADFSEANLSQVTLNRALLRGSNLSEANLKGAQLQDADLSGANLRNANLQEANLQGANLKRADLRDADLAGANLRGVTINDRTLVEGTNLKGAVGSRRLRALRQ
jgi:uncharacterized protein YjbI with pentapeptide repeats